MTVVYSKEWEVRLKSYGADEEDYRFRKLADFRGDMALQVLKEVTPADFLEFLTKVLYSRALHRSFKYDYLGEEWLEICEWYHKAEQARHIRGSLEGFFYPSLDKAFLKPTFQKLDEVIDETRYSQKYAEALRKFFEDNVSAIQVIVWSMAPLPPY